MELVRHLRQFETWSKRGHTQRGGFYIERGVFSSAFIVRKLIENRKVSDEVRSRTIHCDAFRAFRPLSDRLSKFFGIFDPNTEYDLSAPEKFAISTYDLMSEIMHSYVFIPVDEEDEDWRSFFVNSYIKRDDRLLLIQRAAFESVLRDVIQDKIVQITASIDPTSGKIIADVRRRSFGPNK